MKMSGDYEDYDAFVNWDFRPYLPVRPYNHETNHFIRENVFIHHWQRMMTRYAIEPAVDSAVMREDKWFVENESWRYPVLDIFAPYIPTCRETRIASNFVLFLGGGSGVSYLADAEKLSQKFETTVNEKSMAYLSQWAIENNPFRDNYYTTPSVRFDFAQSNQKDMFFQPEYHDIKTMERMAYWCGTDKGQNFLASCERTIKNMQKKYYPKETENQTKRRGQLASALRLT